MDHLRHALRRHLAYEPYRRLTDDELWVRVRDHREEGAFRVFLEKTGGIVYALSRSVLGNDTEAEEAFQEAFCALFRHRAKLASYPAAVAWLLETAKNKARTRRRWRLRLTRREHRVAAANSTATADEAGSCLAEREQNEAVVAALASLPTRERRAVELVYLAGMTHAEAAEALGWSRGSVGTYVARGLDRLRRALGRRGVAVVGGAAALAGAIPGVPTAQLLAVAEGVWARAVSAADPIGGWWLAGNRKLAAGLVACAGLATVGGVAVRRWLAPEPQLSPNAPAAKAPAEEREPLRAQILRILQAEVAPQIAVAFRELVIGDGEVVLESAEAFDTRADCTFALKHRPAPGVGWTTRVRLIHEVDGGGTWVMADPYGTGDWRVIDQGRPIVLWRTPLTGREWVIRPAALERAVAAFRVLPRDERTAAEKEADEERLLEAFRPYLGVWYRRGDPRRRCEIEYGAGGVILTRDGGTRVSGLWRFRLMPDGSLRGLFVFRDQARFSPDGRRIDFPRTGDWWSREPVR